MKDQEGLLDNITEAKQGWFTNHIILSRQAKLAWCFHLAEMLGVSIEFERFNPLSGTVNKGYCFSNIDELKAILVVWKGR